MNYVALIQHLQSLLCSSIGIFFVAVFPVVLISCLDYSLVCPAQPKQDQHRGQPGVTTHTGRFRSACGTM